MNQLLERRSKASAKGASLAAVKTGLDALLTELSRPENGTVYDRDFQTKHQNPFADSRFDAVPELEEPKTSRVDFLTDKVDGKDRVIAPGAHDVKLRSKETQNALDAEKAKDEGLTIPKASSFDFEYDRDRKIARKVASNRYLRQFVTAGDVKVSDDILMVNIPRGKFTQLEFSPATMARMEREIATALHVRAKYAHTVMSSGFDGISFEFMLV